MRVFRKGAPDHQSLEITGLDQKDVSAFIGLWISSQIKTYKNFNKDHFGNLLQINPKIFLEITS